jgi:hypothetical protein
MKLPPPGHVFTVPATFQITGFDPYTQTVCGGFLLSGPMLRELEDYGPEPKLWDTFLVEDTLCRPTVVLEGLRRTNYEQGLCYCSRPANRWVSATDLSAPPERMVFCVYVNPVGSAFNVLDWNWRKVGPSATGIPHRWQRNFKQIVWPMN